MIGQLARAGLLAPAPAPPDRAAGRVIGEWDAGVLAGCRAFAREAQRVRWRQYRSVWGYVEGTGCRRRALLEHFGDHARTATEVPCCDACVGTTRAWAAREPFVVPRNRSRPARPAAGPRPSASASASVSTSASAEGLEDAIVEVVETAQPPVGRTRAVEILRGGRSKVIAQYNYDGLPGYGTFAWMRSDDVLARVDDLIARGTLRSTGGRFPKLQSA
jgi:ATP-dependent DNA helicase RecQ